MASALKELIQQEIIASGGLISFARFMELALYTPQWGYYASDHDPFSAKGDFITAPDISPLFMRCIAKQCQEVFNLLPGSDMVEIGAGKGVFASQLLLECEVLGALPDTYYIVEHSEIWRNRQEAYLSRTVPHLVSRIVWLDTLPASVHGILFANEVMDALPFHCFQVEKTAIKERCVTWNKDHFCWEIVSPISSGFKEQMEAYHNAYAFKDPYESEINLSVPAWIQSIAGALKKGLILLFDYGYGRGEYYHPDRTKGTLMCYHRHERHTDPFLHVGSQDITAHVDFTTVIENAVQQGCELAGYTTQSAFLMACGILDEPDREETMKAQYQRTQAIKKLIWPSEMGESIKVMALSKSWDAQLRGFSLVDRRRDL